MAENQELNNKLKLYTENISDLSLVTEEDANTLRDFTKSVTRQNADSLNQFNQGIMDKLGKSTKNLMLRVQDGKADNLTEELVKLTKILELDVEEETKETLMDKLARIVPILSKIQKNLDKKKKTSKNIDSTIDAMVTDLNAQIFALKNDNNIINQTKDVAIESIANIRKGIVGLAIKANDESQVLDDMLQDVNVETHEQMEQSQYIDRLKTSTLSLMTAASTSQITVQQAGIIVATNNKIIDKAQNIISVLVPTWRTQIIAAVASKKSQQTIEFIENTTEMSDKLVKKVSGQVRDNFQRANEAVGKTLISAQALHEAAANIREAVEMVVNTQQELDAQLVELKDAYVDISSIRADGTIVK